MANVNVLAIFIGKTVANITISAAGNVLQPYDLQVQNSLTFAGGTTALTSAKLETLIDGAQDASALHTHDGRYRTETELSATTGTSGAELIGTDATTANHTPGGSTVNDFLSSIDSALASAGGTDFSDSTFRISDNTTPTKKIAFEASGIAASTVRTITMPDTNVNLGDIAANTSDIADLRTTQGTADGATSLGTFAGVTIPDTSSVKSALQSLETAHESLSSTITNFEWQTSALDYVVDNTAVPATEVTGNRYILSADGGAPNAAWDGASAGDIVEFGGVTWAAVTPTVGTFIAADDEANGLYLWGGAAWSFKAFESTTASGLLTKTGFNITIANSTAGNLIVYSSGGVAASVTMNGDITMSDLGATTIGVDKVTTAKILNANVTAAKLATNSVETAKILDANVTTAKIANDAVDKTKVAADVGGNGMTQTTTGEFDINGVFITATNANAGTLAAGTIVRISAAGSFDEAQADSLANSDGMVGVLLASTATATVGKIQVSGQATVIVEAVITTSLTAGGDVWLSKASAGKVTQANIAGEASAAGNTIAPIGKAIGATSVIINIGQVIEVQ